MKFGAFAAGTVAAGCVAAVSGVLPAAAEDAAPASLYEAALQDLAQHDGAVSQVCGFVADLQGEESASYRFDADRPEGRRWVNAEEAVADPAETGLPDEGATLVRVSDSMFTGREAPRYVGRSDGLAVFAFDPVEVEISGMGQSVDIAEHVRSEVGIDPQTGRFAYVRLYAPDSFKPHPVARFREFETRVDIGQAWEGGPLVRVRAQNDMVISAMFQTHDIANAQTYSGFRPCAG